MTIGELFNKSINNIKSCYKELLMIICVVQLPFLVVIGGITGIFNFFAYTNLEEDLVFLMMILVIIMAVVGLVYYIAFWIANGAVIKILNEAENYNYITWKEGLQYSWNNKKNIILLNLFIGLFAFIGGLIFAIVAILVVLATCGIGLIIIIPLYIFVAAITVPIINIYLSTMVIKDLGVMDSVRETNKIFTKDNFKNISLKMLVVGGCYSVVPIVGSVMSLIPIIGTIIMSILGVLAMVFVMSCNTIIVKDEIIDEKYEDINF